MTYTDILKEARAHERAGRWSAASDAYRRGARMLDGPTARPGGSVKRGGARRGTEGADAARARCEAAGLKPGDILVHRKHGSVRASCVYRGPTEIEYAGRVYGSLTGAARAAAGDLGLTKAGNGWVFWGLEKQQSPTFTEVAR